MKETNGSKLNRWYKDMNFYHIWPRSFQDSNGDGIGDLQGIRKRLDYLQELGMDGIWLSPIYATPNKDYGYDVSDYYTINPEFGTMEDFDALIADVHARGMKLIMDLVVNHTSSQHKWFLESKKGEDNPYHDYYLWKRSKKNQLPNNWDSLFEGKAWEYEKKIDKYYLHIFSKGQPDLNHDNPKVREEVKKVMRFWLEKGVDGFRADVITFISKDKDLPDDHVMPFAKGLYKYTYGPNLKKYIREYRAVAQEYGAFLLGEAPVMNPKRALQLIREDKNQALDMMFHFQYMLADCFMIDFLQRPFNLRKLKRAFSSWQTELEGKGWNALYLENHDHPRILSRYGSEKYHRASGKMLAAAYLLQKGTAFVYQGQEIGMTNIRLKDPRQYKDVQLTNQCSIGRRFLGKLRTEHFARKSSRGSARTPMQWDGSKYAGFSTVKPWFYVNRNYTSINVKAAMQDKDSIWYFYKALLAYRKSPVIRYGTYRELDKHSRKLYIYERSYQRERVLVVCSFTDKQTEYHLPGNYERYGYEKLFGNYDGNADGSVWKLRPYETVVIRQKGGDYE